LLELLILIMTAKFSNKRKLQTLAQPETYTKEKALSTLISQIRA